MLRSVKAIFLLLSVTFIMGCAGKYQQQLPFSPEQKLAYQINRQIAIPELQNAVIGIMVQSAETGEILYEHNAQTVMMPASNEKIPTSVAALLNFGPDFRYETKIYTNGTIVDSVLNGDLIIVGSGDPTFGYRFCDSIDSCFIFQSWADSLKSLGIRKIDGDVIGIDDIFDDELIGNGWTVDNLPYSYAAQISGLMFNENYITISLTVDSLGENIRITTFPDFNYVIIDSQIEIDDETDLKFNRIFNTNIITINGTIEPNTGHTQRMSIHNPTLYFLTGLKTELNKSGISIAGEPKDADEIPEKKDLSRCQYLFSHYSIPLNEVLKILLKESQNLYAESLIKLLGAHFGDDGTFEEGEKILKQTLRQFGLEEDTYSFIDGSGLCRYNYISPAHIVKILRRMYYHPYGQIFRECLPIAGIDGTIGYRMKGTVAQGKVFAKTGTISNVRCLSGYATTRDGETLIFSTIFNNFLCSVQVVMDVQDQICMLLTSFSRKKIR